MIFLHEQQNSNEIGSSTFSGNFTINIQCLIVFHLLKSICPIYFILEHSFSVVELF